MNEEGDESHDRSTTTGTPRIQHLHSDPRLSASSGPSAARMSSFNDSAAGTPLVLIPDPAHSGLGTPIVQESPSGASGGGTPILGSVPDSASASVNAESEQSEWQDGQQIDEGIHVVGPLGSGGMAIVHRVHHSQWNLDLAVKSPRPRILSRPEMIERFIREALAWIELGAHPNIVTCHFVKEIESVPRIFMELVEGGTLRQWIRSDRRDGISLGERLDLMIQACDGLTHAHESGMVHRDVKPENLLVTSSGSLRVSDFGLVKLDSRGIEVEGSTPHHSVSLHSKPPGSSFRTRTGAVMGTLQYAAPEQFGQAESVDSRADVYSIGIILYELFCGRRPFDPEPGQPIPDLMRCHLEVIPADPRVFNSTLPNALADLILNCLAKDRSDRPHDMRSVRNVLAEIHTWTVGHAIRTVYPIPTMYRAAGLNNRGASLWALHRYSGARDAWRRALLCDPMHPEATFNLLSMDWQTGRSSDIRLIRSLELLSLRSPLAVRLLEQVNEARGWSKQSLASMEIGHRTLMVMQHQGVPICSSLPLDAGLILADQAGTVSRYGLPHDRDDQLVRAPLWRSHVASTPLKLIPVGLGDVLVHDAAGVGTLIDLSSGTCRTLGVANNRSFVRLASDSLGSNIYALDPVGWLTRWDPGTGRQTARLDCRGATELAVTRSSVVLLDATGRLRCVGAKSGKLQSTRQVDLQDFLGIWSLDGVNVLLASRNGRLLIIDEFSLETVHQATIVDGSLRGLHPLGSSDHVIVSLADGSPQLWSLKPLRCLTSLPSEPGQFQILGSAARGLVVLVTAGDENVPEVRVIRLDLANMGKPFSPLVCEASDRDQLHLNAEAFRIGMGKLDICLENDQWNEARNLSDSLLDIPGHGRDVKLLERVGFLATQLERTGLRTIWPRSVWTPRRRTISKLVPLVDGSIVVLDAVGLLTYRFEESLSDRSPRESQSDDRDDGEAILPFDSPAIPTHVIAVDGGARVLASYPDGTISLHDPSTGRCIGSSEPQSAVLGRVVLSWARPVVYVLTSSRSVERFDYPSLRRSGALEVPFEQAVDLAMAGSPESLIVGTGSGEVLIFDPDGARAARVVHRCPSPVSVIHAVADRSGHLVGTLDGTLFLLGPGPDHSVLGAYSRSHRLNTLDSTADGVFFVCGDRSGSVAIWHREFEDALWTHRESAPVSCVRFSVDGRRLFVAAGDLITEFEIRWDLSSRVRTGKRRGILDLVETARRLSGKRM